MNLISLSGNITKNAKIFNVKNTRKLLDTIAIDRGNHTDFIDIEAWANTNKSLRYLITKLTKGNSLEVTGEFNRSHFINNKGQRVTKTDVRINDTVQLKSNNFSMNTALITGRLTANANFDNHNNITKISFTVASDDNGFASFIPIEYWTNNSNVIDFWKRNAVKGNYVEVVNGRYYVDKFKDRHGVYQDYSDIVSSNIELGTVKQTNDEYEKHKIINHKLHSDTFSLSSKSNSSLNKKKVHLSKHDLPFY